MSDSTVYCDPADPSDREERAPSVAGRASPFLRKLFGELPKTSQALHVPDDLRAFITSYMGERGWIVTYITGQMTKTAYVSLEAKP